MSNVRLDDAWQVDLTAPEEQYLIAFNDPTANAARNFPNNYIRTAKYTILTFLPINLFEQFRRFANFYFLLNALFSLIPDISPIGPTTSVTPLVLVLTIAAFKDAVEDYQRHKADKVANATPYTVIRDGQEMTLESQKIVPGDFVKIHKGEQFPADLTLLASSGEEGVCYVETSNLDGESNLKRRMTPRLNHHVTETSELLGMRGNLYCELPSEHLYKFDGKIIFQEGRNETTVPLTHYNLLLRGARLRNTKWVIGIVVYAGADTKMYKNLKLSLSKFSHLEKKLNRLIVCVFIFNVVILFLCAILAGVWQSSQGRVAMYLGDIMHETPASIAGVHILTYFILFTYLIPISLFVTMEMVRAAQAKMMEWDVKMAQPGDFAATRMQARNSMMNEELGVIGHVFSDKTGTLTRNVMTMAQFSIEGDLYVRKEDPEGIARAFKRPSKAPQVKEFLRAIALCNTVVPEEEDGKITYEAQSPDEGALVEACADFGVKLLKRRGAKVEISVLGEIEEYEVLATLEFTPDRKRMSVIVKTPDKRLILYCKGADSHVFPSARDHDPLIDVTKRHLHLAAKEGLRTLAVAQLELDPQMFHIWKREFDEAETSMVDREAAVEEVCARVEQELTVMGCTAVEDKLQDQVPETIQFLLDAGVSVWLLTGDKQETAENIGYSSSLLSHSAELIRINTEDAEQCGAILDREIGKYSREDKTTNPALIIDGPTLHTALQHHPRKLLALGERCQSVICCRVTPLQKALVVKLVKNELNRITLAIGDGANDVSMIQEANVGVGIMGREGTQAVRAADFAISEFRFLARLMTVHGRYSLVRLSTLIQYSFYKNITYIFPQFLYGFYSGFSGQVLYDEIIMSSFNIVFAATPPLAMGIFEKDISEPVIDKNPQAYLGLKTNAPMTTRSFFLWLFNAVYHAMIIYFFSLLGAIGSGGIYGDGMTADQWVQGCLASCAAVLVVLFKAALTLQTWNVFNHLSIWLSMFFYLVFVYVYSSVKIGSWYSHIYGTGNQLFRTPVFYLTVLLVVIAALAPDIAALFYQLRTRPYDWQILRERFRFNLEKYDAETIAEGRRLRVTQNSSTPQLPIVSPAHSPKPLNSLMLEQSTGDAGETVRPIRAPSVGNRSGMMPQSSPRGGETDSARDTSERRVSPREHMERENSDRERLTKEPARERSPPRGERSPPPPAAKEAHSRSSGTNNASSQRSMEPRAASQASQKSLSRNTSGKRSAVGPEGGLRESVISDEERAIRAMAGAS